MKIYKRPIFSINEIHGLPMLVEDNNIYQIDKQDIVIEIDLKLNNEGELVESPVAICTKFELAISIQKPVLTYKGNGWDEQDEHEMIQHDIYDFSKGFEVDVNQDFLEGFFKDPCMDIPLLDIDFNNNKIYL